MLSTSLAQLTDAQLIRQLADEEWAYIFKHVLTQETAYDALLKKSRRELHHAVAQTYESLYANALDEYAVELARHYAETDDAAKALEYETRAGDVSARVNAPAEALEHYARALALAKSDAASAARLVHLYTQRGRMFELSGKFENAVANYSEMLAFAKERGDRALQLAALMAQATIHSFVSNVYHAETARELSNAALALAQELDDRAAQAKIWWNLSLLNSWTGDARACVECGEKSLALAREMNLRAQMAYTLNDISFGYLGLGDPARAAEVLDEARLLWQELDNRTMLGDNLLRSSYLNYTLANYDLVQKFSQEAYALSETIGNLWGQCESLSNLAGILAEQGEIAQALEQLTRVLALSRASGHAAMQVLGSITLARMYESLGAYARGAELAENASRHSENIFPAWQAWANAVWARILFRQDARSQIAPFIKIARRGLEDPDRGTRIPILLALAEISFAQDDFAQALELANRALAYAKETRFRPYMAEIHLQRAYALDAQHDAAAYDVLRQAQTEAESSGARRSLWKIFALRAKMETARGNYAAAETFRQAAREQITFIVEHTPQGFRESFLNLPEAQQVMREGEP